MKPFRFLTLLIALCMAPAVGVAQDVPAAAIDSLFAEQNKPDVPGAALVVMRGDEIIYEKGYGSANLEYGLPITPRSVFLVASVSKQFTAFAIAMLAEQGKLSLDDNIRKHVPEMHDFGTPITLRHLIHHTSGLRDEFDLLGMAGWRMDDVITKEMILNLAYRQRALNFEPGSEYSYCNTGYTLLAETVERVTGQSFREWTTENIFAPLGMAQSHFHDDYRMVVPDRVQGYVKDGDGFKKEVYSYQSVGASGLFTTAEDLAKWVRNFKDGTVGGPAVIEQVHERGILTNGDTLSYAFGLGHGEYKGHRRVSHSGWHRGFRTNLLRFPDDDLAFILLGNLESFNPVEKTLQVADLYFAPSPEKLADYAGTYYSEELDTTYTLAVEDDRLVLHHRRNNEATLAFDGPDQFTTTAWYFDKLVFTRQEGTITGFTASTDRARNVAFVRTP
ncbi:MAG TPA: serine hydrolase domain-containing protein [Rhodothermales bacterium]|nr:serine hydrolase domain-containing protein [Rhodothermales bacterium]